MAGTEGTKWESFRHVQHSRDVALWHVDRKAGAHIEIPIRLGIIDAADRLDELKDRLRRRQLLDNVGEGLRCAHQLAPTVAGYVDGVMDLHASVETIFDRRHVDMCGIEQRLAISASVAEWRQVTVRRARGDSA